MDTLVTGIIIASVIVASGLSGRLVYEEAICEETHNVYDCTRIYVPTEKETP